MLQAFFPGEEGAPALAALLTGDATPSGRLPVSLPRSAGSQPYSYLHPLLGGPSGVTSTDPTPVRPFGFGLSYTSFRREGLAVDGARASATAEVRAGDTFCVAARVTNTGAVRGADVVQVYAHRSAASVTRPLAQLVAYARVELEPGESAEVRFTVPASRLAYSDRALRRVVEAGEVELRLGSSCADVDEAVALRITGPTYELGADDARFVEVEVRRG